MLFWFVPTYNQFVKLRNKVDQSRSDLEVVLKKRIDLIMSVATTVSQYGHYEGSVLERITALRSKANSGLAGANATNDQITRVLPTIYTQVEHYPDLKAAQFVGHLQQQLIILENQIASARNVVNSQVTEYNTMRSVFPTLVVGWYAAPDPMRLYKATDADLKIRAADVLPHARNNDIERLPAEPQITQGTSPKRIALPVQSDSQGQALRRTVKAPSKLTIVVPARTTVGSTSVSTRLNHAPMRQAEPVDIIFPRLSEYMNRGRLVEWRRTVGDLVNVGDVLATIETDDAYKAQIDVHAEAAGRLQIVLQPGTNFSVGTIIGYIVP